MKDITVTVDGVTKAEYTQATHVAARRLYSMLAVLMVIICGVIIVVTGNARPAAFIGPAAVYVIFVAGYEILMRVSYHGQLERTDPVVYTLDALGWHVSAGTETREFYWKGTPDLRLTRDCLFLYNDEVNSNLLPRRLLTEGQVEQIRTWYRDSRPLAKEYQRELWRKEREEKRNNPSGGGILGGRGPAWGPRKWKK